MTPVVFRLKVVSVVDGGEISICPRERIANIAGQRSALFLQKKLGPVRSPCSDIKKLVDLYRICCLLLELTDICIRFVIGLDIEIIIIVSHMSKKENASFETRLRYW